MITDVRASKMYLLLHQGESVASVSRRLEMSQKTVRKYRDTDQLPSQIERPKRNYRTRQDPLAEFWGDIESLLQQDSQLKPYAILDWLKQKYNPPQGEPRVTDSIRRTLERRVQRWKLQHGVEQDVKFPQVHHAGDVIAFDFVVMNSLKVTVSGKTVRPHAVSCGLHLLQLGVRSPLSFGILRGALRGPARRTASGRGRA